MIRTFTCLVGILLFATPSLAQAEPKDKHDHAAAEIKKLGGHVKVVKSKEGEPESHVTLWQASFAGDWQGGDAGLAHLQDLANVTRLSINDSKLSDAGLTHLRG